MDESFDTPPPCLVMTLPVDLLIPAARTATLVFPANSPPRTALAMLPPMEVAVLTTKYWGPKPQVFGVRFLDNPTAAFRRLFLAAANSWDCSKTFAETSGDGDLRLTRDRPGYYSYIGTDNAHISADEHTMNLQGFTEFTDLAEWLRVPPHEVGHFLGMTHEHRRRKIVDRIVPTKAYAYFLRWQGWGKAMVDVNVLTPDEESTLLTPTPEDVTSIMAYPLPGAIMDDGVEVPGGPRLNRIDLDYVDLIYPLPTGPTPPVTPQPPVDPPVPKPPEPAKPAKPDPKPKPPVEPRARRLYVGKASGKIVLKAGEDRWFRFEAAGTQTYAVATRGDIPLKMALYGPGTTSKLVASDDETSGLGPNAAITAKLRSGMYWINVSGMSDIDEGKFNIKVAAL